MSKAVLLKKDTETKITWLILNRPEKLNTFNADLVSGIQENLIDLEEDKNTHVVIITGAGEKAFSAGADITEFTGVTPIRGQYLSSKGHELFGMIEKLPQPVIAAINGYAFGGGLELALACDFRLAAESAKIGLTEVNLSLIPGWGGTQRMPRIIGLAKAREAIMFAKRFTANEALEIGLVDRVFPNEAFEEEVQKFATTLAAQSPIALRMTKQCLNYGAQVPLEVGLAYEAHAFGKMFTTKDLSEGIAAFLQKRKPKYKNE
ncbi:MAG: enoyl-CoA hydratase/isomerase family protein [Candidatus Hodarchaeota archaeon]